jgi:hypothetical protein
MKTYAVSIAIAWPLLFAGLAAEAAQPPQEERKLAGDELAEFYLQQILDQAEDEPIEFEQRDLVQELKTLIDRLGDQHRQRLAQRKAEAEQRAAEAKAKAEQQAAEAKALAEQHDQQPSASDRAPRNADDAAVVHLKPVVIEGEALPPAINGLPPMRKTVPDGGTFADPTVRPEAVERLPAAPPTPKEHAPTLRTSVTVPDEPENRVRGLIVMLDQVIARLLTVRMWLATAASAG